ncbi:translation initiation factor IF3 [Hirsutella rhossiliensis]|uniref:Translation initiation factor IF3 n=1 Tax=Hirsutella rhossiliensis TaxID=111463 RepID=A0A9P8ML05_9HYPO|nr:translation initiation factor IF3 [Hirsutella rhossiliensis]KAH0957098.1 translation initiation factor IF3 [Hirsutella rhossiliensis]
MMCRRSSGAEHLQLRLFTRPSRPPPNRAGGGGGGGGGYGRSTAGNSLDDDGEARGFDKRYTTRADIAKMGRDRPPQDHEITDPYVMVIDGGAPEGPLAPRFVMKKLQPDESLRMVQPYVPADAEAGRWRAQLAVCKIVNKRDEYARQRQLKERRRAEVATGKGKSKELELSWSIGEHDLAIKLRQMGKFLAKGIRVEVAVVRKRGGKRATPEEAAALVKRVREEAAEQGGREKGEAAGETLRTMKLVFEGKASS